MTARRAAWLRDRLTGPEAERDWIEVVPAALEALLDRPWPELLPRERLRAFVDAQRSPERSEAIGRLVAAAMRSGVEAARRDDHPVARFVDEPTLTVLVRLVRRPGLVPESWVRHLFGQKGAEELAADTLYRSLRDFSTVLPRTLAAVLPGLLGRFAKLGSSIVDRVVDEIEPRLEPEIRRFVEKGTRSALDRASDFAVAHLDAEINLDGRESLLRFWLDSPPRELVASLSDEVMGDVDELAVEIGRLWASSEVVTAAVDAAIDDTYAEHGELTLRELFERHGVPRPTFDASWAEATWPALRAALDTPAIAGWLERLAAEFPD